jgi:hypothetical protein
MFGPKIQEVTGCWENCLMGSFKTFSPQKYYSVMKSKMRYAENMTGLEKRQMHA